MRKEDGTRGKLIEAVWQRGFPVYGRTIRNKEKAESYLGSYTRFNWEGYGEWDSENGESYSGDWVHNVRQGMGVFTDSKGTIYEGTLLNDLLNGEAKVTYTDGTT